MEAFFFGAGAGEDRGRSRRGRGATKIHKTRVFHYFFVQLRPDTHKKIVPLPTLDRPEILYVSLDKTS